LDISPLLPVHHVTFVIVAMFTFLCVSVSFLVVPLLVVLVIEIDRGSVNPSCQSDGTSHST
jgi:hypothetical protein